MEYTEFVCILSCILRTMPRVLRRELSRHRKGYVKIYSEKGNCMHFHSENKGYVKLYFETNSA